MGMKYKDPDTGKIIEQQPDGTFVYVNPEPDSQYLRSAGQGLTFGFADEIEAAARSAFTDETYSDAVADARRKLEGFRESNPWGAGLSEVAGGLFTGGVGGARAVGAMGLRNAPRLAQLAGVGALEGGLYGLGAGEGAADSLGGATKGTVGGAILGAGVGRPIEKGLEKLIPQFGPQRWTQPIRNAVDEAGGPGDVRRQMASRAPGTFMADLNPEMRGIAQHAGNKRGGRAIAEDILETRQRGMASQIDEAGRRVSDSDYYRDIEALQAARKETAAVNYGAIKGASIDVDEDMAVVLQTPFGKAASKRAKQRVMQDKRMAEWDDAEYGSLEFWNEWKKAADGLAEVAAAKPDKYMAKLIRDMRDDVVSKLDDQTDGLYEKARREFAEPSRIEEKMIEGRKMFKTSTDPEEVISQLSGMNADQKAGFLAGVVREIKKIAGDKPETANAAWATMRSPNFQAKLRAAIGNDEKYEQFIKTMRDLTDQNTTYNVVSPSRGSRTAPMQQMEVDIAGAGGDIARAATGDMGAAVGALLRKKNPTSMKPEDYRKMIEMMLSETPDLGALYRAGQVHGGLIPALTTMPLGLTLNR